MRGNQSITSLGNAKNTWPNGIKSSTINTVCLTGCGRPTWDWHIFLSHSESTTVSLDCRKSHCGEAGRLNRINCWSSRIIGLTKLCGTTSNLKLRRRCSAGIESIFRECNNLHTVVAARTLHGKHVSGNNHRILVHTETWIVKPKVVGTFSLLDINLKQLPSSVRIARIGHTNQQ